MKLYGDSQSGNCYKIQLLLSFLQGSDTRNDIQNYEWKPVDILAGETQAPAFLKINPNGKIPLLVLDDGRCLSESNAILNYLAEGSEYLPSDAFERAKVLQWQFFEQYSHEPYIAVARFIAKYLGMPEARKAEFESKQQGGLKALSVMDEHLAKHDYLLGQNFTIADISLYAYTHVAHEGGFDLSQFPAVSEWLTRITSREHYLAMP